MPKKSAGSARQARWDLALLLFAVLFGSYAYFWHARDWNASSRLMLTYSLVERQDLSIDGLEQQAGHREGGRMVLGDLAFFGGRYYTEKAPGQSLLAAPIFAAVKHVAELEDHPLYTKIIPYWTADYWLTLFTSGVLTASLGVLLYAFSLRLGSNHLAGVLIGAIYGLGTPAFLYGTLFYGHQTAAFCTFAAFFLLYRAFDEKRVNAWHMCLAGFLAGFAVVVEYPTIGVGVVLAGYIVCTTRQFRPLAQYVVAAAISCTLLVAYNYKAFGNPLEFGYAHLLETSPFRDAHSDENPLGLRIPAWETVKHVSSVVLWGRFRGLAFYAPCLLLAIPGLLVLGWQRQWGAFWVILGAFGWTLAVNVSYPAFEGGWCTGPRLLVPALPFAALALASLAAVDKSNLLTLLIAVTGLAGMVVMLGCVSLGGRFRPEIKDPTVAVVIPHWQAANSEPTPPGVCRLCKQHLASEVALGRQFEWNVGRWIIEHWLPKGLIAEEPSPYQALQFLPLVLFWLLGGFLIVRMNRMSPDTVINKLKEPVQRQAIIA